MKYQWCLFGLVYIWRDNIDQVLDGSGIIFTVKSSNQLQWEGVFFETTALIEAMHKKRFFGFLSLKQKASKNACCLMIARPVDVQPF